VQNARHFEFIIWLAKNIPYGQDRLLSFLFCSAKKETKKAVENQLLCWFSMARAPIAPGVGIYRTSQSCHKRA